MLTPFPLRPRSKGQVRIESKDPSVSPKVIFDPLADPQDRRELVDGIRFARRLAATPPLSDYTLQETRPGAAVQSDEEILDATRHWAKLEGIFAAPEGAAALAAYGKLRSTGFFKPEDTVVLFNTGSGLKYLDVLDQNVARAPSPAQPSSVKPAARHIGGIIGPY